MAQMSTAEWIAWVYEDSPYLHDLSLAHISFPAQSDDHEHCAVCWAKISNLPDTFHEGYVSPDRRWWICPDCFGKYSPMFRWTERPAEG